MRGTRTWWWLPVSASASSTAKTGGVVSSQGLNLNSPRELRRRPNFANLSMQNSPLVVPDPSGVGDDVVVAGTYGGVNGDNTQGFIAVYQRHQRGEQRCGQWGVADVPPRRPAHRLGHRPRTAARHLQPERAPVLDPGVLEAATDGGIFAYGNAPFFGSMGGQRLARPVVGIAATPDRRGYWEVASDGGIFAFGDAGFHGSMGASALNQTVVGIASTPDGGGYWEVASDGGVFAFGDAAVPRLDGRRPPRRARWSASPRPPDGRGYWEVASDGGVFAFGDAQFHGSMGASHLNLPVVGIAPTSSGAGYWMVASDGGIFAFGDAGFHGSMGGAHLNRPVVGMAATHTGNGYWMVASDGGVFSFGDAFFRGSAGNLVLNQPVTGVAANNCANDKDIARRSGGGIALGALGVGKGRLHMEDVYLEGATPDGPALVGHLSVTVDEEGLTVVGPSPGSVRTVGWDRLSSLEFGPATTLPGGVPGTSMHLVLDGRPLRLLVPSARAGGVKMAELAPEPQPTPPVEVLHFPAEAVAAAPVVAPPPAPAPVAVIPPPSAPPVAPPPVAPPPVAVVAAPVVETADTEPVVDQPDSELEPDDDDDPRPPSVRVLPTATRRHRRRASPRALHLRRVVLVTVLLGLIPIAGGVWFFHFRVAPARLPGASLSDAAIAIRVGIQPGDLPGWKGAPTQLGNAFSAGASTAGPEAANAAAQASTVFARCLHVPPSALDGAFGMGGAAAQRTAEVASPLYADPERQRWRRELGGRRGALGPGPGGRRRGLPDPGAVRHLLPALSSRRCCPTAAARWRRREGSPPPRCSPSWSLSPTAPGVQVAAFQIARIGNDNGQTVNDRSPSRWRCSAGACRPPSGHGERLRVPAQLADPAGARRRGAGRRGGPAVTPGRRPGQSGVTRAMATRAR